MKVSLSFQVNNAMFLVVWNYNRTAAYILELFSGQPPPPSPVARMQEWKCTIHVLVRNLTCALVYKHNTMLYFLMLQQTLSLYIYIYLIVIFYKHYASCFHTTPAPALLKYVVYISRSFIKLCSHLVFSVIGCIL